MIDRNVSVDFDVNGAQYGASLQQMIAVTQQYNSVADTTLGKMAKLSGFITNTMMKTTSGLTQANKIATGQAAAYQQKLSGLEATAKILGEKTFPKLEKATLKLARDFPIGIGQAVAQMESLQESGITTAETMGKLSQTYTRLGAATGTYAPAIGQAMTEFTRSMGNNLSMAEGFSDTLVTLTKQYGGSAASVLAFSKSIAPIASTIGLNQAQVTGLSTAFARLGEDGFAAGNALNKVMIDLNRAARDGGPELRAYANAMNKDVGALREQLNTDPASVLIDFTEAINAKGPDAIRTLETLGIEGVRTVKAFTSLSREGNLGEILDTAGKAYGSGSTMEAAQTALSGVNDQMTTLSETTSQMIAAAGTPFLEWLQKVLGATNAVTGAFTDLAQSPFMQNAAKLGGLVEFGGTLAQGAVGGLGLYALGRRTQRAGGRARERFQQGQDVGIDFNLGRAPTAERPEGMLGRLGENIAYLMAMTERGGGGDRFRDRLKAGAVGTKNLVTNAAILGLNMTANDFATSIGGRPVTTPGGTKLRDAWNEAQSMRTAGDTVGGARRLSEALKEVGKESISTTQAFGSVRGGLKELGKASAALSMDLLSTVTGLSKKVLIGGGIAAGIGAAGYGAYSYIKNQSSDVEAGKRAAEDPYRIFNEFAARAGYATESITLLGKAAEAGAKALADRNTTDREAFTLSKEEMAAASLPGYQPAFTGVADATAAAFTAFLSNTGASKSQISMFGTDVQAQLGGTSGQQFLDTYKGLAERLATDLPGVVGDAMKVSFEEQNWAGMETESSKAVFEATADMLVQRWSETGASRGAEAGNRQKEEDLGAIYERMVSTTDLNEKGKLSDLLESLTDIDRKNFDRASNAGKTWEQALAGAETSFFKDQAARGRAEELLALNAKRGTALPETENAVITASQEQTESFNRNTGATIDLTKTLYAGNKLAAENGKAVSALTDAQMESLSAAERAVVEAQRSPNDPQAILEAGRAIASETYEQANGDVVKALGALTGQLATAPNDGTLQSLVSAYEGFTKNRDVAVAMAGQSQMGAISTKIALGAQARQMELPQGANPEAVQARESMIAGEVEGIQELMGVYRNYLTTVRNAGIQMARQDEDLGTQRRRARRDFNRQMAWQEDDYQHSRLMANKQFNLSMARGDEDYLTSRRRARRDFAISMARNEESFNRSRMRSQADFDRQLVRQAQDNAKAMYDPYQRVEHQRVWDSKQLIANLRQQNDLLKRQAQQVDTLKAAGLSQEAIDLFGFADPAKAQQLARSFGEMMNDPALIASMNEAVAGRVDLASAFTVDEDNVGYRRQLEDFTIAMSRAQEDYAISREQARADFDKQLSDMSEDFKKSKSRAREDFNTQMSEMDRSYNLSRSRARTSFNTSMADMAADAAKARGRMVADIGRAADDMFASLQDLAGDTSDWIAQLPEEYREPLNKAIGKLQKEVDKHELKLELIIEPEVTKEKSIWQKAKEKMADFWDSLPWGGGDESATDEPPYQGHASGVTKWTGGKGSAGATWYQKGNWTWAGGRHNGIDVVGVGTGTMVHTSRSGRVTHSGWGGPEGGWAGNNVIQDIGGGVKLVFAHLSTNFAREDQLIGAGTGIGRTGNTGRSFGAHLHVSAKRNGTYVDPRHYLAEGGIVTRPTSAMLAEAGYPELVLPLNERGAKMLAETMARYLGQADAKSARVAPYSSMVVNNSTITQDYSTNFTGPIHVEATDAAELARSMRAHARSRALVQPIGARR